MLFLEISLKFLLQFPAGHMQLISNEHYSPYSAWIAMKLGAVRQGSCQLSCALLFSSTRAFSTKRTFSNFRSNSWRGLYNNLQRATAPPILLGLGSTTQGSVSLPFGFLSRYFSAPPEHFCEKNYLNFSL
jgi:hypothetical protein